MGTGSTTGIGDTVNNAKDLEAFGVALCDPNGVVPENVAGIVGTTAQQALPVPSPTQSYVDNKKWYSGVQGADAAGGQRNGVLISIQKFWDPVTAAQASGGAFCCDAMYYGKDGIGRGTVGADPPIVGVTKNENFKPVRFVGATMNLQVSPGGVCTDGKPTTYVKEEEFLEGQAFYACLAPSQYVLPKISTQTVSTQTANAAKQKKCAQTMTKMLKMNKVSAGTKTDDAKCKTTAVITATGANQALTGAGTPLAPAPSTLLLSTRSGLLELAVLPLLPHTLFPTDTATLTLALRTLLPVVQPRPSRAWRSSQLLRAARTWPAILPPRRTVVDAPTRLVRLRLLAGTEVRLSLLRARRSPATLQPARLLSSKGRSGCFPQPDFLSVLAVVRGFELLQAW